MQAPSENIAVQIELWFNIPPKSTEKILYIYIFHSYSNPEWVNSLKKKIFVKNLKLGK